MAATAAIFAAGILSALAGPSLRDIWRGGDRIPAATLALTIPVIAWLVVVATGGTS